MHPPTRVQLVAVGGKARSVVFALTLACKASQCFNAQVKQCRRSRTKARLWALAEANECDNDQWHAVHRHPVLCSCDYARSNQTSEYCTYGAYRDALTNPSASR
jgi:hypothetical protein